MVLGVALALALGGAISGGLKETITTAQGNTYTFDYGEDEVALVIIDPQVDFHEGGLLPVAGAMADAGRIADFINTHGSNISRIFVSLDSHQPFQVSHATFWKDREGNPIKPDIIISEEEIGTKYFPVHADMLEYAKEYARVVKDAGKPLYIWPEHCLIGTSGGNIVAPVADAILNWSREVKKPIKYLLKGQNTYTESYSALKAEAPLKSQSFFSRLADRSKDILSYDREKIDPIELVNDTKLNEPLIKDILQSRKVFICGEARSHCVNNTARDIIGVWNEVHPATKSKLYVLEDCTSNVPGLELFTKMGEDFFKFVRSSGGEIVKSTDVAL